MRFIKILVALVFVFGFITLTYGQRLNTLDKTKRSNLFQLESILWCSSIHEGIPGDSVRLNEIYANDLLYLWVRIKGTPAATESLSKGVSPAYIKLFRVTSYGLTPELTPPETYKMSDAAQNNNKSPNNASQKFVTVTTGPLPIARPGSYYVKLLDYESNTILINDQPLIRFEVKSRIQNKKAIHHGKPRIEKLNK